MSPTPKIFLTGKLWNTKHASEDVEAALDKSRQDLDLFLMHWPVAFSGATGKWFLLRESGVFGLVDIDPATTYKAMKKLFDTGKGRAIGVFNFNVNRLNDILPKIDVVPAVNQIEAHPYLR
ncbi:L-glyceraldehyde reductase [Alternaria panax]|uniref:L-glyceraldehyde reductase n=1 Tax=Alternaria panax TaxID=48097 RepID=A0AAD4NVY6_9PLEO|nr:L-glyceraldehyde reductase [Alternaria panax]